MTDRTMKQQIIDLLTYNEEGLTIESLMMHSGATEGWVREVAQVAGLANRIKPASDVWYASEDEEYEPDMYTIYSEQSEVDVEVVDLEDAYSIFNVMVDRGDTMVRIEAMPMEEEVAYHEGINSVVLCANGYITGMTYTDIEEARQDMNALWVNGETPKGLTAEQLDPTHIMLSLQIRETEHPYLILEDTRAENSDSELALISELNALGFKMQKLIDDAEKLCLAGSDTDRMNASPMVSEYTSLVTNVNRRGGDYYYADHASPAVQAEHAQLVELREQNDSVLDYCLDQLAKNIPGAYKSENELANKAPIVDELTEVEAEDLVSEIEEAIVEMRNAAEDALYECAEGNFNAAVTHLHEYHEVKEALEFGDIAKAARRTDSADVESLMQDVEYAIMESSVVADEATEAIEEDGTEEI